MTEGVKIKEISCTPHKFRKAGRRKQEILVNALVLFKRGKNHKILVLYLIYEGVDVRNTGNTSHVKKNNFK